MRRDGLVRLCFGRKNKTLGAIFRQKQVLEILEQNHKVRWCTRRPHWETTTRSASPDRV
jgi:hypothetical protein